MQQFYYMIAYVVNSFLGLALAVVPLIGMSLVIFGLYGLATSKGSGGVGQGVGVTASLRTLFIGSMLMISMQLLDATTQTLFNEDARLVLDYQANTTGLPPQAAFLVASIYIVVGFIGYLAFFRGWLKLRGTDRQRGESPAAALIYIIAGAMAVNLDTTMTVTANTVALFSLELADLLRVFIPA